MKPARESRQAAGEDKKRVVRPASSSLRAARCFGTMESISNSIPLNRQMWKKEA